MALNITHCPDSPHGPKLNPPHRFPPRPRIDPPPQPVVQPQAQPATSARRTPRRTVRHATRHAIADDAAITPPLPAPWSANDAKEQEAAMIVPPSHHSAQALANRPTTCAFSASLCRILLPHRAEPASRKTQKVETEGHPQSSHAKPHRAQFDSGCGMRSRASPGSASNTVLARNVPDRHQKRRDNRAFSHKPRRHVPSDSCDMAKQNDGRRDRRETPAPSVATW